MHIRMYTLVKLTKIQLLFAWYDLWVGAYWDQSKKKLYVLPVPCLGFVLSFENKLSSACKSTTKPDVYCGMKFIWNWNYRFWSWFTSHGIESGRTGGHLQNVEGGLLKMVEAPQRVFDRVYHFGPLKIKFGILK